MENATMVSEMLKSEITSGADRFPMVPLTPLPAQPKVSVLITSYNYGQYLAQAIESALDQSWPDVEVVVSDDGSTDNSCEVADRFARAGRPVILQRGFHQGMAGCLNAAFRACHGDIVCFLDADDYFLPGKIESLVQRLQADSSAGFAIHRARMIDQQGHPRGLYPLVRGLPKGNCAGATLQNAGVLMGLPPTSNLALRREIAERIFPLPIAFTGYAEQVIHRLAPLMTSICAIDQPLSVWRLHGRNDGNSARVAGERLEREIKFMVRLWEEQLAYLSRLGPEFPKFLPPLEASALYLRMRYMLLRLRGEPARSCHAALSARSAQENGISAFFWRHSLHLPLPLFRRCIDLLQTQSIWKEWLGRALYSFR
jgi:glycosyltransferase involved in cell wall biosynthesis